MKTYTFPYYYSFGKGDSVDCELDIELTDEQAARLEASAKEEYRFRLYEDDKIKDICDEVCSIILEHDKQIIREDPFTVADYFDVPEGDVTEELIEQYFEKISMGVNYPEKLQDVDEEEQ